MRGCGCSCRLEYGSKSSLSGVVGVHAIRASKFQRGQASIHRTLYSSSTIYSYNRRSGSLREGWRCGPICATPEGDGHGEKPEGDGPDGDSMNPELKLLIDLIVEYPATRGTIAALLGYFAHINPLATLHFNQQDVVLGIVFAAPILFWDALIMVPNWDPPKVEKKIRLSVPRSAAEKLGETILSESSSENVAGAEQGGDAEYTRAEYINISTDGQDKEEEELGGKDTSTATKTEDMVVVERTINVRAEQGGWKDALRRTQVDRAMNNAGQLLHPASEALLLFLVHFSEEMLYRGFGLTFAIKWTTDRIYEATGEDVISVFGGAYSVPVPTVGAAVASLSLVTVAIYLLLSRDLKSLKVIEQLENSESANKTLMEMKDVILSQQRWNIAVTAISEIVQWTSATAAFLYTGNLLAPIAGALVSDAVCSFWQRDKLKAIQESLLQDSRERLVLAKQAGALVDAMKEKSDPDSNESDE